MQTKIDIHLYYLHCGLYQIRKHYAIIFFDLSVLKFNYLSLN